MIFRGIRFFIILNQSVICRKEVLTDRTSHSACLRGLEILEAVTHSPQPLSLEAVATATGIPKATAHRMVNLLVDAGALLREAHAKTYSAGPRLNELAINTLINSSLRTARQAVLKGLVDQIGETCNFTTLDSNEVVYIDRVETGWPLRLHLQPGSRVPIHCTSSGKLFLSQMPPQQRRHLIYGAPLKRFTLKTITDPERLEAEVLRIRKSKVSTDDEGFLNGLISVAVPVFDERKRMIGGIAVHAPSARLTLKRALTRVPLLRHAAAEIGKMYRLLGQAQ